MGFFRVLAVLVVAMLALSLVSCKPDFVSFTPPAKAPDTVKKDTVPLVKKDSLLPRSGKNLNEGFEADLSNFTEYFIPEGQQNCLQSRLEVYGPDVLEFDVLFDSSAIYTSLDPANQADINKLFGFSDCGNEQHTNSARFGWRYYKNQLQLLAYTYSGG